MPLDAYKLKWRVLWLGIGWLLVATIVYLSLAPTSIALPGQYGDQYGHVAAYAALMYWFAQIYSAGRSRTLIVIGLALLGIGLEIAQYYTGYRTFERADMMADVLGIAVGWLAGPPRTPNVLLRIER